MCTMMFIRLTLYDPILNSTLIYDAVIRQILNDIDLLSPLYAKAGRLP